MLVYSRRTRTQRGRTNFRNERTVFKEYASFPCSSKRRCLWVEFFSGKKLFLFSFIYIVDTFLFENESEKMYKVVFKMKRTCGILDADLIRIENFLFFFSVSARNKQTNEKTVRDFENPADLEK